MGLCKDQREEKITKLARAFDDLGFKNISQEEQEDIIKAALQPGSRIFKELEGLFPEEIWEREVDRCIELKFYKELGLTEQQFTDKDFFPLPEDRPNPLAVIPEIITLKDKRLLLDISTQMSLIEVDGKKGKNYLDLTEHEDLIEIPDRIYWIYEVEDGSRFAVSDPLTSPEREEKILKKEKRTPFATIHGISLVRRFPEVLNHHYLDLPGSRYESAKIPCLGLWDGRPRLGADDADDANSGCGVPSFRSV